MNKNITFQKSEENKDEEESKENTDKIIQAKFSIKDIDIEIRETIIDKINKVYSKLK